MITGLFPFQRQGVLDLVANKRWGLWDQQGLGKTIQAIAAAREISADSILVICPAHLCLNWKHDFKKWWPERKSKNGRIRSFNFIQGNKRSKKHPSVLDRPWDLVIVDEAQGLKSWDSKQTQNFKKYIFPNAQRLWLLSGTPATRAGDDYHAILSFLMPGKVGKYGDFARSFSFEKKRKIWIWVGPVNRKRRIQIEKYEYSGFRNTGILNKLVRQCSTRRLKSEVLPQLPPKLYGELYVDVGACDYDFSVGEMQNCSPLAMLGVQKVKAAAEWILERQEPALFFSWFQVTCEALKTVLGKRKYALLTGKQSRIEKVEAVRAFQEGELDSLICQTKAGGTGWNLQRAETICVFDVPWSWADMDQISDRANRIGSLSPVKIITCIAEGTSDDKVLEKMYEKREGMEAVLDRSCDVDFEVKKEIMGMVSGGQLTLKKKKGALAVVDNLPTKYKMVASKHEQLELRLSDQEKRAVRKHSAAAKLLKADHLELIKRNKK